MARETSKTSFADLFNRYIWLTNLIYSRKDGISLKEIQAAWKKTDLYRDGGYIDLPRRTFCDHIKAVEQIFDIIIECDKHNGYRYYIEDSDSIQKDELRRWLLGTLSVSNQLRESRSLHHRILLEDIPSGQYCLTTILEAIHQNRVIEARHRNFTRGDDKDIQLEPYSLKLCRQRWYVLGRDLSHQGEIRNYALDRLSDCRLTDHTFTMPEDFDAEAYYRDFFGVFVDAKMELETIRLRVEGVSCQYFRTLPLHHSQKEVDGGILTIQGKETEWCVFEYRLRPTVDFINELVSRAKYVRVQSPEWLADRVKEDLMEIVKSLRKSK